MTGLQNEAARFSVGLTLGIYTTDEVIHWAEDNIRQMKEPLRELIDLALMPNRHISDVARVLDDLAENSDRLQALRQCLSAGVPLIQAQPDFAPVLAKRLYSFAIELNYDLPDDLKDILSFDDEFDLAMQGIIHSPDKVRDKFIRWCRNFGS